MPATLEITDQPDGVRVLTLSNPAKRNALDSPVLERLREAVTSAPASVRALLVRGEGSAFSAGYDLEELARYQDGDPLPDDHVAEVLDVLSTHALPSVALISGPAFGAGCELAMACDVRVGSEEARFCMPPVTLGLVYSRRGFERFVNRVGPAAARFLFLTGRQVAAQRALELGLIDVLVPSERLEAEAMTLAKTLAAAPSIAIAGTKAGLAAVTSAAPPAELTERYEALRRASYASPETRARVAAALFKKSSGVL